MVYIATSALSNLSEPLKPAVAWSRYQDGDG